MKKIYITWENVEHYIDTLCRRYRDERITGVYGFPRGGLVLAVMASHRLGIPLLISPVRDCLIVDDICDSGESLLHYQKNSSSTTKPMYHISTMIYKDNPLVTPEYYWGIKQNEWIVFPWEDKECIE